MAFTLPDGLAPEAYPLAWLVGRWRGEGVVGYPGIEESAFTQDVVFDHDGGPYLRYTSTIRLVVVPDDAAELTAAEAVADPADPTTAAEPVDSDDSAEPLRTAGGVVPDAGAGAGSGAAPAGAGPVWSTESGYWRVAPERPTGLPESQFPVEVLMADPSGHLALYVGSVGNGRIDLVSDLIARTSSAAEVAAGKRLYGLVNSELMWAWDLAAFGHPMQTYASARLARVEA